MKTRNDFAARLRALLAQAGWTQAYLAERAGLSAVSVRRYLMPADAISRSRPTLDARRALAMALAPALRRTVGSVLADLLDD